MFANKKSSRLGFAAIIAVLATALGGCAESVASGPEASFPLDSRNAVTLSRLEHPQLLQHDADTRATKSEPVLTARNETKRPIHVVAAAAVH